VEELKWHNIGADDLWHNIDADELPPSILIDQYRRAADVDRILKGEKPAELPVQAPTK